MAIRNIRQMGEPVLRKICKPVKLLTPRTQTLIDDMLDTMYEANGVGLAAPQVGVLKRIVVMINPEILETSGEQTGSEGCLSLAGKNGQVTRPNHVKVRYMDRDGEIYELEGEELLARAICHECDHLDGKLYVDIVEGEITDVEYEEQEETEENREQ